jgi:hypothetical protein
MASVATALHRPSRSFGHSSRSRDLIPASHEAPATATVAVRLRAAASADRAVAQPAHEVVAVVALGEIGDDHPPRRG